MCSTTSAPAPRPSGRGRWVVVRQVFITRLKEQRYPTRDELDQAAPENPVLFATGPDASLNSLALKLSGIDQDFRVEGPGKVEKDPPPASRPASFATARGTSRQSRRTGSRPSQTEERLLLELFRDYNSVGITSIIDRDANPAGDRSLPAGCSTPGRLPVRLAISHHVETLGTDRQGPRRNPPGGSAPAPPRRAAAADHRHQDLSGRRHAHRQRLHARALGREQDLRDRRSELPRRALHPARSPAADRARRPSPSGLQFTAHSVGDGAVHALLDAYEEVNKKMPIAPTRPCITHSNFMSREAIEQAARLGVVGRHSARLALPGYAHAGRSIRLRPAALLPAAAQLVRGGSDRRRRLRPHAEDRLAAVDQPVQSVPRDVGRHHPPGQRLTRASSTPRRPCHASRRSASTRSTTPGSCSWKTGSARSRTGKHADFVVIDRDLLTCPADEIKDTHAIATYLDGKNVFSVPR